jgi:hypothetical protein
MNEKENLRYKGIDVASIWINERHSRVVNTPSTYSEVPGFKSRPGDRLP